MTGSVLSSYLLTNRVAVKTAIKVSVSVWGALVIALLMNFEHPIWAMITGMISFFAPDHAQVVKKCLFQCISTVLGGLAGLLLMAFAAQSPLMIALGVASIIFVVAATSYHTRDGNFTFCCAIFAVTIAIMVMVPGFIGPTSETFITIFIDRVGTIIAGIAWAALVSAALWPAFTTDILLGACQRLAASVLDLNVAFEPGGGNLRPKLANLYASLIECEDLANHCSVEGHWGKRGARIARAMNRISIEITSESYAMHQLKPEEQQAISPELDKFASLVVAIVIDQAKKTPPNPEQLSDFIVDLQEAIRIDSETVQFTGRSLLLQKLSNMASQIKSLLTLHRALMRSERVNVKGVRIRRHLQIRNSLTTGFRSSLLFLIVFGLWYATGWTQGFLIAIVPIVFSIMLGKLPHPEIILKKIVIGTAIGIPVGLVVFVLLAQAPSAVELLILTAGGVLFLGLMGLSSLMSFPYSLGFCLSYLILILPLNTPELALSVPFAIERSLAVGIGASILALLYVLLPRHPLLKSGAAAGSLFADDLRAFLMTGRYGYEAEKALSARVGIVVDKLVTASLEADPARREALVEKAGQCIFLMTQVRKVEAYLQGIGMRRRAAAALLPWKTELYRNYMDDTRNNDHQLVDVVAPMQLPRRLSPGDSSNSRTYYLREHDYLIRRAFQPSTLQEKMQ